MKKAVLFTYISNENRKYIETLAKESGQTLSYCADAVLDSARTKKHLKIEKSVPQYVAKARVWAKKNPQIAI